jgi:hypothetical protein
MVSQCVKFPTGLNLSGNNTMRKYSYQLIKKEIMSKILGSRIWDRSRIKPTFRFKYAYYNKITDEAKKNLVHKVIIEMLSAEGIENNNIRCRAAYIASEIGLTEAMPVVEKLAMDKSLQGACLLLIERAQEYFNIDFGLSYKQMEEVLITLIGDKYGSRYFRGEFPYDFKTNYYSDRTKPEKKKIISEILINIMVGENKYSLRQRCYAAYWASLIGLMEANSIANKIESEISITKDKDSLYTLKQALNNFKDYKKK